MNLNNRFLEHLINVIGVSPSAKYLLAVSGGVDSMVMLHLFHAAGINISVAHCNYSLRAKESDLDHKLVRERCEQLAVPFFDIVFDTKKISKEQSTGIQETARKLRYDWFQRLASDHQFDFIATAHHQDDTVETILFNLIRGTGLKGLEGIPLRNKNIIRPLLFASKNTLLQYAQEHTISYRIDASNLSNTYSRNKIRNTIIPLLTDINPEAVKHIYTLSSHSASVMGIASEFIQTISASIIQTKNDAIIIDCKPLEEKSYFSFFLYETLHPYGFNSYQTDTIKDAVVSLKSGIIFQSASHTLTVNRSEIIIQVSNPKTPEYLVLTNANSQSFSIGNNEYFLSVIPNTSNPTFKPQTIYLDADKVAFPVTVRTWQAGDFFSPLGMSGKKKISDYLIDKKLSLLEKENVFVLISTNHIVAILNHQIDENFKITPATQNILQISRHKKTEKE